MDTSNNINELNEEEISQISGGALNSSDVRHVTGIAKGHGPTITSRSVQSLVGTGLAFLANVGGAAAGKKAFKKDKK